MYQRISRPLLTSGRRRHNILLSRGEFYLVLILTAERTMRRRRAALKVVRELDAFPKVENDYQRPTARGGTLSIVSLSVILFLVVSEFFYYRTTEIRYRYSVDTDLESKLLIGLDISIAMSCEYLGADIVDLAGESKSIANQMKMEPAIFELTDEQLRFLEAKRRLVAANGDSKSLNELPIVEVLGMSQPTAGQGEAGVRLTACRIHGSMEVKKVAGNFHITIGRSVPHPQGHAHLNLYIPRDSVNFSHRIDHFSFGSPVPGAINPLDGVMKITDDRQHIFQYYLQVVPTKFRTFQRSMDTNQYSVTERNRTINHQAGSHGVTGIFFKYDMSPMVVEITEERRPFWQFLVRLCGIIGGIFATSGMLNTIIGSFTDGVLSRLTFKRGEEATTNPGIQENRTNVVNTHIRSN